MNFYFDGQNEKLETMILLQWAVYDYGPINLSEASVNRLAYIGQTYHWFSVFVEPELIVPSDGLQMFLEKESWRQS